MLNNYKWAKIYRGKNEDPADKRFVYYSYLNPNTAKFERIKVYEDINYLKDAEQKNAYANELVKEINTWLKAGYNPFEADVVTEKKIHAVKAQILLEENPKSPTLLDAFKEFLANKTEKDLAGDTLNAYRSYIGKFEKNSFSSVSWQISGLTTWTPNLSKICSSGCKIFISGTVLPTTIT